MTTKIITLSSFWSIPDGENMISLRFGTKQNFTEKKLANRPVGAVIRQ